MGRILKKKDPEKKKTQRLDKSIEGATVTGDSDSVKPAPVLKKAPLPAKPKVPGAEPGFLQKSIQFLREVKIELKKVTWPSRKQTMGSTVVVIILVMIISLFLGLVDFGLSSLIRVVLP
ncbi:MAG: preprotein translocase subunit SecE [Desulfobacteraceae bacterium]|nr:MAG: preprotein translocase subunit SecE [Desulfobacteraceae bacterium]